MRRRLSLSFGLFLGCAVSATVPSQQAIAAAGGPAAHPWAKDTPWAGALQWAETTVSGCRNGSTSRAICEGFIAEALARVFAIEDFKTADSRLSNRAIRNSLREEGSGWVRVGSAFDQDTLDEAQDKANQGLPVIAILSGQGSDLIAFILPGETKGSGAWNRSVPNSGMLIASNPTRSYLGKRLSFAFRSADAAKIALYYRPETAQTLDKVRTEATALPEEITPASDDIAALFGGREYKSASLDMETARLTLDSSAPSAADTTTDGASSDIEQTPTSDEPAIDLAEPSNGAVMADMSELGYGDHESAFEHIQLAAREHDAFSDDADPVVDIGPAIPIEQLASLEPDQDLKERLSGTWCDRGSTKAGEAITAVMIDANDKTFSLGLVEVSDPKTFKLTDANHIVELIHDGDIVGITFAKENRDPNGATAFFILDGANKLFETHVFDHESNEILVKNALWERCS